MTRFFTEIGEQPESIHGTVDSIRASLEAVLPWVEDLRDGTIQRVVFTGMGASYYAIYPAMTYLIQHGITALAAEASELLYYHLPLLNERTLLVVISQSGHSVEVRRIVELLDDRIRVIGITNNRDSPLAQRSNVMLYLNVGDELTVSTKTYTSTLAALHGLAHLLAGESAAAALSELRGTADRIERWLPIWQEQVREIVEQVARRQFFVFLGRGPSQASALTGALITKESAKLPTEGMNSGQFRHGPIEVTDDRAGVFIFTGFEPALDLNLTLAQELADLKARVTIVSPVEQPGANGISVLHVPGESAWTLPIAEIVPVQLFAALLAEQRGFEPGKFRYIQKVTTRE